MQAIEPFLLQIEGNDGGEGRGKDNKSNVDQGAGAAEECEGVVARGLYSAEGIRRLHAEYRRQHAHLRFEAAAQVSGAGSDP
jgi:hypothetical protein